MLVIQYKRYFCLKIETDQGEVFIKYNPLNQRYYIDAPKDIRVTRDKNNVSRFRDNGQKPKYYGNFNRFSKDKEAP